MYKQTKNRGSLPLNKIDVLLFLISRTKIEIFDSKNLTLCSTNLTCFPYFEAVILNHCYFIENQYNRKYDKSHISL